jgi:carbamate kinase
MRVVVALGGNAFVARGAALTMAGQFRFAHDALAFLAPLFAPGTELLLTHGNGPQVGHELIRVERSQGEAYALPLDVCVAETQGELGYVLARTLRELFLAQGLSRPVAALVTQVEVDPLDPAFRRPEKPVGPYLDEAAALALTRRGAVVRLEPGRGLRRVVPSPEPRRVLEVDVVRRLLEDGVAVVAAGGGGIPVARGPTGLAGVEAVVDKDLTAALLADELGAGLLLVITDVPCAFSDWRTPAQAAVGRISASRARALLASGHFGPGSMAPKVEACARFASRPGRRAVICDLPGLAGALRGEGGTTVHPD